MPHRAPLATRAPVTTVAAMVLAAVALAGCGSSHAQRSTPATATHTTPAGPATTTTGQPSPAPARHRARGGSAPASGASASGAPRRPSHPHGGPQAGATSPGQVAPTPNFNPNPPPEPGCPRGAVPCVTKTPKLKPIGSSNIDVNLQLSILRNQPLVKRVKVSCPRSVPYPISCSITGTGVIHGRLQAITGTATVLGVETSTRTYAYSLLYKPARG